MTRVFNEIINVGIGRNKTLDFIRGIAVVMVMLHHNRYSHDTFYLGTTGVQLFFVLSGFLVGGLLLKEIQKAEKLNAGRFILRRGFKIWPQFYFFLIVATSIDGVLDKYTNYTSAVTHKSSFWTDWWSEVFFVQNYTGNLFSVTWSLAVEEHFYLILPLWALLGLSVGWFKKDVAGWFISISVAISIVFCTWARVADWHTSLSDGKWLSSRETQQHLDALFFGVLLSFWHITKPDLIGETMNSFLGKWIFPILAVNLICFGLFYFGEAKEIGIHNGTWASGLGCTALYVGYGLFIMVALHHSTAKWFLGLGIVSHIVSFMGWLGFYSYALYLWHRYMFFFAKKIMVYSPYHDANNLVGLIVGFCLAVAMAVITTHTIEKYFLNLRNKLFPKQS